MKAAPKYSVVVPVYNRPHEVDELLASLTRQTYTHFEVVIVEDGSSQTSEKIVEKYSARLSIQYFYKPNSGPGPSRNYGFAKAKGEYFVVFDSDCMVPDHYFEAVEQALHAISLDAWGGPDRGHENFTALQQAMGYTMSSVLTTGGIRGGNTRVGSFQPRSFNMGISREVFEKTEGFRFDRFAEDIEFSIRMKQAGFKTDLIADAYVYHKRRTSLAQFYDQVSNFGRGRVMVGRVYAGAVKLTHWFPSCFTLAMLGIPLFLLIDPWISLALLFLYGFYFFAIAIDSFRVTRSVKVAFLSIPAAFIQITGYGIGFLKEKAK